jgi:hypothetical protein
VARVTIPLPDLPGLRPPGAPPIWTEYLRLDALVPAERNPKTHDLPGNVSSLNRFGAAGALAQLDERTGRMVGGHGRREALIHMKSIGDPIPKGVMVDEDGEWLIPVERGWRSANDLEAEAMIVALNQLTTAGGWHMVSLAEILEDIATTDATLLDSIGFVADDIDNLINRVDPETFLNLETTIDPPSRKTDRDDEDDNEYVSPANLYDRGEKTHVCPSCGYDFKD